MAVNKRRLLEFEERRQQWMAKHAGDGRVVDVGYVNFPNRFLRGEVIGLDLHAEDCPPSYARVVRADALRMPLEPSSIDAVVAGELVEHLQNPLQYFLECNRVLKPGGKCIFSVPNPYHPSDIFKNVVLSDKELFTDSHLSAPAYRMMVKLLTLAGFILDSCDGDYLRIPKLHWLIPMGRIPGLAYRNLYAAHKEADVDESALQKQLAAIHAQEAEQAKRQFAG